MNDPLSELVEKWRTQAAMAIGGTHVEVWNLRTLEVANDLEAVLKGSYPYYEERTEANPSGGYWHYCISDPTLERGEVSEVLSGDNEGEDLTGKAETVSGEDGRVHNGGRGGSE